MQLDETIGDSTVNWLDTYYVYDNFGRLKWQVPPKAVAILDANPSLDGDANLAELIYKYTYDDKGRLVEKKEPGAVAKYMVYDLFDRVVLTQDGTMQSMGRWAFVKYDLYGRAVYTGLYKNSRSRISVQKWVENAYTASSSSYPESSYVEDKVSGADSLHGYSNVSFPKDSILRLAVSYYDNYDFNANGTPPFAYDNAHLSGIPTSASANVRGMATGSKRRLLSATGNVTANWIKGAVFYDSYDRVIQTQSNNHLDLNAVDKQSVLYNTIRRVEKTKSSHTAASVTTHITQYSDYDHAGRVLKTYHQINSNTPVVVAAYEYNALGQLVDKKLHNTTDTTYLQSVDYRYNIRGWLKSINNAQLSDDTGATNDEAGDYFGMELAYNTGAGMGNSFYYNGNIAAVKWKGPGASGTANQRSYKYSYDKSDKLKEAAFQAFEFDEWAKETNTLNESMSYDHNGNMVTLARKRNNRSLGGASTAATVDSLSYGYATNSNSLLTVQDTDTAGWFKNPVSTSSEYAHNSDGSLTRDDNKGVSSIAYNFLGKPQVVNFTSGKKVEYVYDAAGMKLTTKTWQGTTLEAVTNYTGGFVYEGSTPALSYFSSPEGRVVKTGSGYEYQYSIADHQGNTRVVFTSAPASPQSYFADMEGATNSNFSNYGSRVNFNLMDNTDPGSDATDYSQKLYGNSGSQVGVAKSFKVYPGDKVSIRAYAKYYDATSTTSNLSGFASALISAYGVSAPGSGEAANSWSALNSYGAVVAGGGGHEEDSESFPKAYVNLIAVDKKYNFLDGAWDQINGGRQVGTTPTDHDEMYQEYVAREEGWVYVFVSNENPTLVEVYFDDVTVTITPGNVIQGNEYYPYGLQTATSWTRESNVANNFLYNGGTELNQTTQVYDLYYRNYDPVLGRFGQVDPMAGQFASLNPYNYGFNDPVTFNDPLGDCPTCGCMVCDAPNLFEHGLPTRKYEGGSLTPFQQVVQETFSGQYQSKGLTVNQFGGSYGFNRGQAFNQRAIAQANALSDARSEAYANGIKYNEFGTSRAELLHMYNRLIYHDEGFEKWAAKRGLKIVTELSGQVSMGAQATVIPTPYGPIPVPFVRGSPLGFYVNLGSVVLAKGEKTSSGSGSVNTIVDKKMATQGIGLSVAGVSVEYTRELQLGEVENIVNMVFFGGALGFEWNITSNEIFVGAMPGARWALGVGVEGSAKQGVKFKID